MIIPVLWEADHILNCIRSIDLPVRRLLVVVNSLFLSDDFDIENEQLRTVNRTIRAVQNEFKTKHLLVHFSGKNLGFGPSLNFGMRALAWADWWLCTSVDITFPPNALRTVVPFINDELSAGTMLYMLRDFAAIALTKHMIERVGYFDEHIWPAYVEDCDLMLRVRLEAETRGELKEANARESVNVTGEYYALVPSPPLRHVGQLGTRQSGSYNFGARISSAHSNNVEYYRMKWGISSRHWLQGRGPFRHGCGIIMDGQFETPFNASISWETVPAVREHDAKQHSIFA